MNTEQLPDATSVDQLNLINPARQIIYQFLSLAFADPRAQRWQRLCDPDFLQAVTHAADVLRCEAETKSIELAPGELTHQQLDLHAVMECIGDPAFDPESEYQQTFGLMMSKKHPPYESEYCPQTFSVYRAQVIADVAGFYRAFGLEPSRDTPERHDHLSLELEFMAWLISKEIRARQGNMPENAEICSEAGVRFLQQHVAWWMPAFAHALRGRTSGFYRALADVLAAFVHVERAVTNSAPPTDLVAPQPTADAEQDCQECGLANLVNT